MIDTKKDDSFTAIEILPDSKNMMFGVDVHHLICTELKMPDIGVSTLYQCQKATGVSIWLDGCELKTIIAVRRIIQGRNYQCRDEVPLACEVDPELFFKWLYKYIRKCRAAFKEANKRFKSPNQNIKSIIR